MAYHIELEFAAKTDTGLIRSNNEDSIAVSAEYGFAILADGMGGCNAGEVASSMATSILKKTLENRLQEQLRDLRSNPGKRIQQLVVESVQQANVVILEASRSEPEYSGMGTTLVLALFHNDKVAVAHVGDSRAYRLRQGEIVQITRDHSLLQEQIDAGLISPELAQFSPIKNIVTRAVGVGYDLEVEIHNYLTEPGDIYLLCSDGLSNMLSTHEICDILTSAGDKLETACDALVQRANDNGGHDNISAILIKIRSHESEAGEHWDER